MSQFEQKLNCWLWVAAIASAILIVCQHVIFRHTPEKFPHGADLGELLYELALAYVGAFIFYRLVVRLPLERDRAKIYELLAPILRRVAGEAVSLIWDLNSLAGIDRYRDNTAANVEQVCKAISPNADSGLLLLNPDGSGRKATALEMIGYHIQRARAVNQQILDFSSYLDSTAVRNLAEIEDCAFFRFYDVTGGQLPNNPDLSVFSRQIFEYLRLVDRHAEYCREIKLGDSSPSTTLTLDDNAIPLSREMKG